MDLNLSCRRLCFRVVIATLMSYSGFSNAVTVDWTNTYILQGSGFENPIIRYGFNPQPEPPASAYHPPDPGLSDSTKPILIIHDQTEPDFRILFGINSDTPLFITWDETVPNERGAYNFSINNRTGSPVYTVDLVLSTSTGGIPDSRSWVGFNPQPEPPAIGDGAASLGFDFSFTSMSDVTMTLQMRDITGAPVSFSAVPLPTSLWLFVTGITGLVAISRKK